jgi:4-hydroxy-3-polyprenylbenzoate decarboxylase
VRVFLGITGASGAPYAERLLQELSRAGCEVGLSISDSGYEVLATELFGDPDLPRERIRERLLGGLPGVTLYATDDFRNPYASGSASVDGYVVCPCSMGTLAHIATGTMDNLIHRAASVALKEGRRLVLVPRETPLSTIHLENMLRARSAGAVILVAAPGFYHSPAGIDDLVAFLVARCLDQLGIENAISGRWGSG